jgi:hypothetical protein
MTRRSHLAAIGLLAACAGAPTNSPATGAGNADAATAAVGRTTTRLRNGATLVVQRVPGRPQAVLQVGVAAGGVLFAPGAAELAAHVVAEAGDAANSRPSLRRRIEQLGGLLQVHVGPLTCWLDIRVAADAWSAAAKAVGEALAAPPPTRAEFERVRRDVVAARTAALADDPAGGMARLLLLGESGGDRYVRALADRDASEVATFLARGWRPELTTVVLAAAAEPAAALAELDADAGASIGAWRAATPPTPMALIDRRFDSGLWWSAATAPAAAAAPCQLAVVMPLPDPAEPRAADEILALGCLTLEGVGGRLERVFADRGLSQVRWQATTVATADATALVLRTEAPGEQVAAIWRALTAARASLQSVQPSRSEIELAQVRAPLLARLQLLDDGVRARRLRSDDPSMDAVDRRLAELAAAGPEALREGVDRLLARPFACIAVGGAIASDVPDVHAFQPTPTAPSAPPAAATPGPSPTPAATVAAPAAPATAGAAARPQPWLEQAAAAAGGAAALRRLDGWRSRAETRAEAAPALLDEQEWRRDGALTRTRTALGQSLRTKLAGDGGTEQLGAVVRQLDAAAIATARRELRRHPLALLAAHVRGELVFRTVTTGEAGDRRLAVLETNDGGFERLRMHIDVESGLVRAVESWETMPDGSVVHLHEAWQDYRPVGVLRAPFHRLTTRDDGVQRAATAWTAWTPVFADPAK